MRRTVWLTMAVLGCAVLVRAQAGDREIVATITGPMIEGGIVSGLGWDGGVLIIQSASMDARGALKPHYFTVAAPGMAVQSVAGASAAMDRYWKMKAGRVSPTGLGRISTRSDTKLPMYGIGSLVQRMNDAQDMGGTVATHELQLHGLVLHVRRSDVEPYDGEVWSWSPAALNRIAYVDGKGDVWIAAADGRNAVRLLKGSFTLPAWSDDGRTLAVAERKDRGAKWEISVIHLADLHRR